jgi:hypothetical protein
VNEFRSSGPKGTPLSRADPIRNCRGCITARKVTIEVLRGRLINLGAIVTIVVHFGVAIDSDHQMVAPSITQMMRLSWIIEIFPFTLLRQPYFTAAMEQRKTGEDLG